MKYTDKQKQEAVETYLKVGTAEAARQTGISRRSILNWAKAAGATEARRNNAHKAREALQVEMSALRAELDRGLLEKAVELMSGISTAEHQAAKNLAIALGIVIDKFRLEMGESTARSESVSAQSVESWIDGKMRELEPAFAENDPKPEKQEVLADS